jgi:hypothetical protein
MCLAIVALAPVAHAAPCGSNVNGRGRVVVCDCGDVLVSSHTLSAADPVTQRRCPDTALTVRIPATVSGASLNFGGQVLAGMMHGIGVHVLAGGADGLALTGPGAIGGFDTGVAARRGSVREVAYLLAIGNAADGLALQGDGFTLRSSEANHNGRDGIVIQGRGFRLVGSRADQNGRYGYRVTGHGAAIGDAQENNQAMGNGRDGFMIRGRDLAVTQALGTANGGRGLRARVAHSAVDAPATDAGNGARGLAGDRAPRCSRKGSCR